MTTESLLGRIVRVKRGREAGEYAIVIGEKEPNMIWLADGRKRKVDRPKKKNRKHVQLTRCVVQEIADTIRKQGSITNRHLRCSLNQYLLRQKGE